MEVVASTASFVSLALTSAHGIHRALTGIKHAPETVQNLSSSVSTLVKILEQLETCKDELALTAGLPGLLSACSEDLQNVEAKLVKQHASGGTKAQRLKRGFMVMLREREYEAALAMVRQHQGALSLQLNTIAE